MGPMTDKHHLAPRPWIRKAGLVSRGRKRGKAFFATPAGVSALLAVVLALGVFVPSAESGEVRGPYLWQKTVQGDFGTVVEMARDALSIANFPVNNVRDYRESLSRRFEQIGEGTPPFAHYRILDFCNVQFAARNLKTDLRMGIFKPCKLVIYQALEGGEVTLMTVNPEFMPTILGNPALIPAAKELEAVIREVFDSVDF